MCRGGYSFSSPEIHKMWETLLEKKEIQNYKYKNRYKDLGTLASELPESSALLASEKYSSECRIIDCGLCVKLQTSL